MSQEELQGSVQLALLAQLVSLVHLREAVYLADTLFFKIFETFISSYCGINKSKYYCNARRDQLLLVD